MTGVTEAEVIVTGLPTGTKHAKPASDAGGPVGPAAGLGAAGGLGVGRGLEAAVLPAPGACCLRPAGAECKIARGTWGSDPTR